MPALQEAFHSISQELPLKTKFTFLGYGLDEPGGTQRVTSLSKLTAAQAEDLKVLDAQADRVSAALQEAYEASVGNEAAPATSFMVGTETPGFMKGLIDQLIRKSGICASCEPDRKPRCCWRCTDPCLTKRVPGIQ